jgi:uncharacterized protein (TIGR02265 family)
MSAPTTSRAPAVVASARMLDRALDIVGAHCDLEARLRDVPPSARIRGVWMRSMEAALERHGKLAAFRSTFPGERASALRWYQVSEFLPRLAVAGALVASPAEVHEGMYEIGRGNAQGFADSLIGRTLIRILSPDPARVIQQGAAARRQSASYGRWSVEAPSPQMVRMVMRSEYIWIESYFRGSAVGTYDAIQCDARVTATLRSPYDGVVEITY